MKSVKELIQYYETFNIEEQKEQEITSNNNQTETTPEILVEENKDQVTAQQNSIKNGSENEKKIQTQELNDSLVCNIAEEPRNIKDLINFFDKTENKIEIYAEEKKDKLNIQQDSTKDKPKEKGIVQIPDVDDSLVCNIAEEPRSIKDLVNFFENGNENKEVNADLDQEKKDENDVLTLENQYEKYPNKEINKAPEIEEEATLLVKDLIDLFEIYGNNRTYSYRFIKRENLSIKFTNVRGLPIKRVLKADPIRKGYFRSGLKNESCLKPSSLRYIYGVIRCDLK